MTGPRPQAVALAARYVGQDHPARQIGEACWTALHGAYSVGVTLAADAALAQRVSLCAVGPLAERGEALQINLGEGPCVQALRQRAPVLADDLRDSDATRQWPVYARHAQEDHIRAAFALPVLAGPGPAQEAGLVLTLYSDRPGPLTAADLHIARDHADAAELLLLTAPVPAEDDLAHAWLLPTDAVVHQAIGMISYRHAATTGQALALLRAHAHTQDTDLVVLAHAIVHEHHTLPVTPEPPGPTA
ncbi:MULTISPECIES: GAF domain-containing protein [Streptomyces]|uniref:GAF domain-containing protein n=1 Tax=Streptomyces TaxID=1883 RepID=UPI000F61E94D|nr:GAF domain-containing protein [Streptomyces chrestomyceticus]